MLTIANAERFLRYSGYSGTTYALYLRKMELLFRYGYERQKPIYRFSREEMQDVIARLSDNVGVQKRVKNLIEAYFEWLIAEGVDAKSGIDVVRSVNLDEVDSSEDQYVHGLPELLSRLERDIKYLAQKDGIDPSARRMFRATVLLLWHGFTLDEIALVKKSDILKRKNSIMFRSREIDVDAKAYVHLSECANAVHYQHRLLRTITNRLYADGEHLLRTETRSGLNRNDLQVMIAQFNKSIPFAPYKASKIWWSGVFYRAYLTEVSMGGLPDAIQSDLKFYEELFREKYRSVTQLKTRLSHYRKFTSVYRNV